MDPILFVDLLITLGQSAANAFGKVGLANLAGGLKLAMDKLIEVRNDPVTKEEVESFRLSPKW